MNKTIKAEIKYRSASDMQDVWRQLAFFARMDADEDCDKEVMPFISDVSEILLAYLNNGRPLTKDEVDKFIEEHPMIAVARWADELAGLEDGRIDLIEVGIRHFLFDLNLIEEQEQESNTYVKDITDWWNTRLGNACNNDKRFHTPEFVDWSIEGASFYFLMNFQIPAELVKSYVAAWKIVPAEILQYSIEYRREERLSEYLERYSESSDEEMSGRAHYILQNEACMVYHYKLWAVTRLLAEAHLYEDLARLYIHVDLPILQASMLFAIKDVEDVIGLTEAMRNWEMNHPMTSFSLIREYFYEQCCRTTANLLSYKSDYTDLQLDNSLSDEWQKGISQWAELLPNYIEQELKLLKSRLSPRDVAGWLFAKQDIIHQRKNAITDGYNQCLKLFKQEVLNTYKPEELPLFIGDVQHLLYTGNVYLESEVKPDREKFEELLDCLTKTVCGQKMLPISEITDKIIADSDIAARLLCECFPNKEDIFAWFDRYKTWYEGWNVKSYTELYDGCHRECHFLCWMLMVCSLDTIDADERKMYWDKLMTELFTQVCAAGGYIRSEYTSVLVMAGLVSAQAYPEGMKLYLENCCKYIIAIDELIVVITNSGILQLLKTDFDKWDDLLGIISEISIRIECEWPLKILRLNMEGPQAKQRAKAIDDAAKEWQGLM